MQLMTFYLNRHGFALLPVLSRLCSFLMLMPAYACLVYAHAKEPPNLRIRRTCGQCGIAYSYLGACKQIIVPGTAVKFTRTLWILPTAPELLMAGSGQTSCLIYQVFSNIVVRHTTQGLWTMAMVTHSSNAVFVGPYEIVLVTRQQEK